MCVYFKLNNFFVDQVTISDKSVALSLNEKKREEASSYVLLFSIDLNDREEKKIVDHCQKYILFHKQFHILLLLRAPHTKKVQRTQTHNSDDHIKIYYISNL